MMSAVRHGWPGSFVAPRSLWIVAKALQFDPKVGPCRRASETMSGEEPFFRDLRRKCWRKSHESSIILRPLDCSSKPSDLRPVSARTPRPRFRTGVNAQGTVLSGRGWNPVEAASSDGARRVKLPSPGKEPCVWWIGKRPTRGRQTNLKPPPPGRYPRTEPEFHLVDREESL